MPKLEQPRTTDLHFTRELRRALTLGDAAKDQHQLRRRPPHRVKNSAGERVENPATAITLVVYHRLAMTPVYTQTFASSALGTTQALRMKPGNQRLIARRLVHQIHNRKVHDSSSLSSKH
jgi:hypothetical protein